MAWFVAGEDSMLFGAPALAATLDVVASTPPTFEARPPVGSGLDAAKPSKCSGPCSLACPARHLCQPARAG
jgi:hypothetical protein